MQDIYCPKCGEPWDLDSLHEEAGDSDRTFSDVYSDFRKRGCDALAGAFGYTDCAQQARNSYRAQASAALMDVLGDDVDGVAAMLDDLGL